VRIRTLDELVEVLEGDLAWRKRELTNVKFMLPSRRAYRSLLLRAAICLLYAHWEGFVKTAATSYVSFVANRGLRYRDLTPNFVALGLHGEIREAGQSNHPTVHTELVVRLTSDLSDRARINWRESVNTHSNLNSETLGRILALLGLEERDYLSKGPLLDQKLLNNRNRIAHGEKADIEPDDYDVLHTEIIQLLDSFNTDVQNAAATDQFRRSV
jgi:hypothetical protein